MTKSPVDDLARIEGIKKFYTRRAHGYEAEASRHWLKDDPFRKFVMKTTCETIANLKANNPKILDIGCGSGQSLFDIACQDSSSVCRFFAVDLSVQMLTKLSQKLDLAPKTSPICLVCGDAHTLPFLNNTFNMILCLRTLQYLRIKGAMKEIKRVLKHGGRGLILTVTVHDDDVEDFRNSVGVFSKETYFSKLPRRSELRRYICGEGFSLISEEQIVLRRYFAELLEDKSQYASKRRIQAVIRRFLYAPEKQKRMYGIDSKGFNQFYSLVVFESA